MTALKPQMISPDTHADLTALRRDLHTHPELGFEEHRTSNIVARRLEAAGLEVTRGLGGTGVVGTLRKGTGNRAILLRADMDALAMTEVTGLPYASQSPGKMHACGHDGHTVMLLGAAEAMAQRDFSGTVHFVFQPAEEGRGGGAAMVRDGFFDRFPVDAAYGLHNAVDMPLGHIAAVEGPQLASSDRWWVTFRGIGTHGAKPHNGRSAMTAAGLFLAQVHNIVAQEVNPLKTAVISACAMQAGDFEALNVVPAEATIGGTARSYDEGVRTYLEEAIARHAQGIAASLGIAVDVRYTRGISAVVNEAAPTEVARRAITRALGEDAVITAIDPVMAGDDFSEFGMRVPGCYVHLGMGPMRPGGQHHGTNYDFNDACIPAGVAWWCAVVEEELR
ncbi:amidohydrolase [Ketogulonicigenium vulgare]|uniref:Hippurate hydrolase protein-like protein amidohydrolase n=1 Tax=Ketogulonicigenium vulgare (strain WSH-001) TaxID=759362 RepID=F9Y6G9_KETVW|nr:amidohydrolase [Ketogulonicigenium vulgare]AEM40915.1 hippurate hydrolase protein-like protein amidohydrolase [Ketogulonicigenium vulgare WSH-001]AOZ54634.1 hippurate hydrolase protein-like protein amidohydrolase [Ketogulonicigenium vulgare]